LARGHFEDGFHRCRQNSAETRKRSYCVDDNLSGRKRKEDGQKMEPSRFLGTLRDYREHRTMASINAFFGQPFIVEYFKDAVLVVLLAIGIAIWARSRRIEIRNAHITRLDP
jgi:hypothetical protein